MRPRLTQFRQGRDDADAAFGQQPRPPGAAARIKAEDGDVAWITRGGNRRGGIVDEAVRGRKTEAFARPHQHFLRMLGGAEIEVQAAFNLPLPTFTLNAQVFRNQLAPDADDDVFRGRLTRRGDQLAQQHRLAIRPQQRSRRIPAFAHLGLADVAAKGGAGIDQPQQFGVEGIDFDTQLAQGLGRRRITHEITRNLERKTRP